MEPLQLNVEGAKTILARRAMKRMPGNECAANWTKTVLSQRTTCDLQRGQLTNIYTMKCVRVHSVENITHTTVIKA